MEYSYVTNYTHTYMMWRMIKSLERVTKQIRCVMFCFATIVALKYRIVALKYRMQLFVIICQNNAKYCLCT